MARKTPSTAQPSTANAAPSPDPVATADYLPIAPAASEAAAEPEADCGAEMRASPSAVPAANDVPTASDPVVRLTDAQVYEATLAGAPTLKALLAATGIKSKAQLVSALFRHCERTGAAVPPLPGSRADRAGQETLSVSIRGLAIGRGQLKKLGILLPEPDPTGSWPEGVDKVRVAIQLRHDLPGVDGPALLVLPLHGPAPSSPASVAG